MALVDWFTNLSDALQVAFVSFTFTLISSLLTVWLTNRYNRKLERERRREELKQDEIVHQRGQRERRFIAQRVRIEGVAKSCSQMSTKLAWASAHSSNLFVPYNDTKGIKVEDLKQLTEPIEELAGEIGLCGDEDLKYHSLVFAQCCEAMVSELTGSDDKEKKNEIMNAISQANARVQERACIMLDDEL